LEEILVLSLAKSGNADAFTELMKEYQKPILRYLFRLTGDYDIASDLAQETFIQAYKNISNLNAEAAFKTWLYRIATNKASQFRRRRRLLSVILFTKLRPADANSAEISPEKAFENIEIKDALLKLPQDQRVCLTLHYVEGFKYHEIAQTLGTSEDAVRMRVTRGVNKLKKLFNSCGGRTL
jgi:RNA polymerase sigma-70 factor (ECF subfamily)